MPSQHATAHCTHCGYDLRGLDQAGSCPECGSAIWLSAAQPLGEQAEPWLMRVHLATRLLIAYTWVLLASLAWSLLMLPGIAMLEEFDDVVRIMLLGGPVLLVCGVYLLTGDCPPLLEPGGRTLLSSVVRLFAVISALAAVGATLGPARLWALGIVSLAALVPAVLGLSVWYWRVGLSLGHVRMASQMRAFIWWVFAVVAVSVTAAMAMPFVMSAVAPESTRSVRIGFAAAWGLMMVASGVAAVWSLLLLRRYDRIFDRMLG